MTTYTQDLTGHLTAAGPSQTEESYSYDDNGNRTGSGTSTGDDNQRKKYPGRWYANGVAGPWRTFVRQGRILER